VVDVDVGVDVVDENESVVSVSSVSLTLFPTACAKEIVIVQFSATGYVLNDV
jgi:hypothetical protein